MTASEILQKYIAFFEKKEHTRIPNSSLVPENDPSTLFTSSGMQPLVPYLLGEIHPQGRRLVNVQNCFRAQDIDEIGDNRHTTFFRMLGNWSLGDYFKKEQIPWFFEFLTEDLGLDPKKLYITVFEGFDGIEKDNESQEIWKGLFKSKNIDPEGRIIYYGTDKNWWSRSGIPDRMPIGEPGGPDSEVFYDFETPHDSKFGQDCHVNCDCGRYMEIGNSVFMQYLKTEKGFEDLPKQNVDFGGGLERLIAATENKQDVFQTSLFSPVIEKIAEVTKKDYKTHSRQMRIIVDHFTAAVFISSNNILPSNKEQGYILRRLIRRGLDNFYELNGLNINPILEQIVEQYRDTDEYLVDKFEYIKNAILEEESSYKNTRMSAQKFLSKQYEKVGDELMGVTQISPEDAFKLYTSYGLSPTQIKSLGYSFSDQEFADKMKEHKDKSRAGAEKKFTGGLADTEKKTIMGHTATHLMHKALRDMLGDNVHQTGSNITAERVRFDFAFDRKLTSEEIEKAEQVVNKKIEENLPVNFEMMPLAKAKEIGAIGLFDDKYADNVKVYFVGDYSKEFCGGPHVDFTGEIKRFKIIKEEGLGKGARRIYAQVG